MTAQATAPEVDFIDAGRMRNRNIRLEINQEEALLRSAEIYGRNVSDVIRRILNGQIPNLVEQGLLCSTCFAVDCQRHIPVPETVVASRARRRKSA